tara:strand:+ start:225 stop:485 length:261 start_codon:yes stop_codon:yes gene_type:complete
VFKDIAPNTTAGKHRNINIGGKPMVIVTAAIIEKIRDKFPKSELSLFIAISEIGLISDIGNEANKKLKNPVNNMVKNIFFMIMLFV